MFRSTTPAGASFLNEPIDGGVFVDPASDSKGGLRFIHSAGEKFYGVKAFGIPDSRKDPAAGTLLRNGSEPFQANAATQGGAGAPFIWTTSGYGFLVDSDNGFFTSTDDRLNFDYGTPSAKTNGRIFQKNHSVRYFHFVGPPKDLFAALAQATGHSPMFPKWAVGFTNSQWGIDQDGVIEAIDLYRARDIPIDNFTFDFDWKAWGEDDFGEFRWNKEKFPAADVAPAVDQPLLTKMNARGVKMTGIMKPRIVQFTQTDGSGPPTKQGKEASDRGFWIPGLESHRDYMSKLPCGELDFGKAEVRDWFWKNVKIHGAMQAGIAGFWNDEADEADLGERRHVIFNNFEHMNMERALYEGQRAWHEDGHAITRGVVVESQFLSRGAAIRLRGVVGGYFVRIRIDGEAAGAHAVGDFAGAIGVGDGHGWF